MSEAECLCVCACVHVRTLVAFSSLAIWLQLEYIDAVEPVRWCLLPAAVAAPIDVAVLSDEPWVG